MFRQNSKRQKGQESGISSHSNSADFAPVSIEYPYRLNFYDTPPLLEITVDDFEQWAIDRMKVLGEIETLLSRNFTFKEIESLIKPMLDKYFPLSSNAKAARSQLVSASDEGLVDISNGPHSEFKYNEKLEEHRRLKDHYSHFILRLAFCRSEELSRRFVHAESTLFKIRLNMEEPSERDSFFNSLNISWEVVSPAEKEREDLQKKLEWAVLNDNENGNLQDTNFFKVDFESVPDLVEDRKIVLHEGKAYVPMSFQTTYILSQFSVNLTNALVRTKVSLASFHDDRLEPLVNHFANGFENFSTYEAKVGPTGSGDDITADMVDGMVNKHFPLCMQTLHKGLLATKHLRYEGRREYGMFLRYIGLSVDEAIQFWRTHFSGITEDKFNKEYRYNIRHQYGLEGSKRNYRPQSCVEIAKGPFPARGEYHGCPYKTFTKDNLKMSLERMGVTDKQELSDIGDYVTRQQYNLACTRVYALTHPNETHEDSAISHPNQYFNNSWVSAKDQSKVAAK